VREGKNFKRKNKRKARVWPFRSLQPGDHSRGCPRSLSGCKSNRRGVEDRPRQPTQKSKRLNQYFAANQHALCPALGSPSPRAPNQRSAG